MRLVAALATIGLVLTGCAKGTEPAGGGGGGVKPEDIGCKVSEQAGSQAKPPKLTPIEGSKLKVGLAFDIGGRGDASFNDAAVAGLDKAQQELGFKKAKELSAGSNESEADKQTRLRQLAAKDDVVIATGFAYSDAMAKVAPKFPKVQFAVVDGFIEKKPDNVTLLGFAEHEGSFLVGVIAAEKSKSGKVGFVGGVEVPLIQKFECGFKAGVKAAKPDATIEATYLTPAGDFTGFNDIAKGKTATEGLIANKKIDVVYHAAGGSGKGVFAAAKEGGIQAIGVDSDQYEQPQVAQYKDAIISSMLKRVDVAVYDYIKAVSAGDLGGLPAVFDLKVDGVGYATSGGKIDDITGKVDEFKQKIIDGEITVPDQSAEG